MCSKMLSFTGKNILNNTFGNQIYIKWTKKQITNIPKIPITFRFFNVKKPPLIYKYYMKK